MSSFLKKEAQYAVFVGCLFVGVCMLDCSSSIYHVAIKMTYSRM